MTEKLTVKNKGLRNNEYYGIQGQLDNLYERAKAGRKFKNLMNLIVSDDNIMLAYRNIKNNKGSQTPSVDKQTIKDIDKLSQELFLIKIKQKFKHFNPCIVKRKEIPKSNGKMRPLGIPSIWDRIIQQCILQIIEPICEAQFINDSFGFRPNRSAEHAIAKAQFHINKSKLYYVVDVDIQGFFDEVDHQKLMRQLWTLGIQDKQLLVIIRRMLKTPIKLPDGTITYPKKGTPQGGILSPLLANINLNELDHWIEKQWAKKDNMRVKPRIVDGLLSYDRVYAHMRRTGLKPMRIVRYADDFKIFTDNRINAEKIFKAVSMWLDERLKLPISLEKSKITNLKTEYSEFLGFKMKAKKKGSKRVAETHISEKSLKIIEQKLKEQIKEIQRAGTSLKAIEAINHYNSKVIGIHNYYSIAGQISYDLKKVAWNINRTLYNRLNLSGLTRKGTYTGKDKGILQYTKTVRNGMRYYQKRPILPIGSIKTRYPMQKRQAINKYSPDGRALIHKSLSVTSIELEILRNTPMGRGERATVELYDNRIALYIAQKGKCPISGQELLRNHHIHHKQKWSITHDDSYNNLVLVIPEIHELIHATNREIIDECLSIFKIDKEHLEKLNKFRISVGNEVIREIEPVSITKN